MLPTWSHRTAGLFEPADEVVSDWEETNCLLCGSSHWSPMAEAPDRSPGSEGRWYMVAQCRECGLCFANPRPRLISSLTAPSLDFENRLPRIRHRVTGLRFARHLRVSLPWHGRGRLLDIGGTSPRFLARARSQGWKPATLIDDPRRVQSMRERFGFEAMVGDLLDGDMPGEAFDVVTMWHTLDHSRDPLRALQAAYAALAPGGRIYASVPNVDSLAFRWFGQHWTGLDLPRRLVYFTPWTLRLTLLRAGFRDLDLRTIRRSNSLRASAQLDGLRKKFVRTRVGSYLASWLAFLTGHADEMIAVASKPPFGRC
ncbi:MAG: class I SAM-dependent methyltransferase [Gemmataceae bacterium]|nr:class I SAM-dependent methyltransferase [Gemmataceae bacterium]